jgi:hypothetical protein
MAKRNYEEDRDPTSIAEIRAMQAERKEAIRQHFEERTKNHGDGRVYQVFDNDGGIEVRLTLAHRANKKP